MNSTRRDFLKLIGAGAAAAGLGVPLDEAAVLAAATESPQRGLPAITPGRQGQGIVLGKDATPATIEANAAVLSELPFADRLDFEVARRGFVATLPDAEIAAEDGGVAWTLKDYAFLNREDAPPTANPSLWRQAQLNLNHGLFKVVDRVYQVRGFDLANMTIIEGDTGLILIDPLMSAETARAGLALYWREMGQRPVVAVIYTHSHADHWGGVKGVTTLEDVAAGRVQILAPERFLEHAVSENAYAGKAMARRADYMYGFVLPRNERGQIDCGIGKANSAGRLTLIPPTDSITATGDTRMIDGVELVFQVAAGSEAPSEMTMYLPQFRVFNSAEIACSLLHNVLTLRGAEVRDANKWCYYVDEAIELFAHDAEVVIAQHNWPRWGTEQVVEFLTRQRDMYKYIHDQTLRLANHGHTMVEIAEMIELPQSLRHAFYCRGLYGSVNHNVKAVYQKYLGWYDGNPANLHTLPPVEAGQKYVEFMGGAAAMLERARADFADGQYRWVAQVMNHLVFAEPDNAEARELAADALEQLGYQAESSTWRNVYLMAAYELRNGILASQRTAGPSDAMTAMSLPMFFDYMGIRLNGPQAEGKRIVINWNFTDVGEQYVLNLENCALTYRAGKQAPDADATVVLTRGVLDQINLGQTTLQNQMATGGIQIEGDPMKLVELFSLLDSFDPNFSIVTP